MNKKLSEKLNELIALSGEDDDFIALQLEKLIEQRKTNDNSRIESSFIHQVFNQFLESEQPDNENFIQTNFQSIDQKLGGFKKGEYIVIGGRPGMGKSLLLIELMRRIAQNTPTLLISLELNKMDVTRRILHALIDFNSPINSPEILKHLGDEKLRFLNNYLSSINLQICDTFFYSMFRLKTYCERMVKEFGIKVIGIDYLQLLSSNRYRHNRELEISYISQTLKKIAKELDVCLIVTSQLSRAVETRGGEKRPQLSDLRESGTIEQDADKVFFMYRPEYYGFLKNEDGESNRGLLELNLLKNRTGTIQKFEFVMRNFMQFEPFTHWNGNFNFTQRESLEDELIDDPEK